MCSQKNVCSIDCALKNVCSVECVLSIIERVLSIIERRLSLETLQVLHAHTKAHTTQTEVLHAHTKTKPHTKKHTKAKSWRWMFFSFVIFKTKHIKRQRQTTDLWSKETPYGGLRVPAPTDTCLRAGVNNHHHHHHSPKIDADASSSRTHRHLNALFPHAQHLAYLLRRQKQTCMMIIHMHFPTHSHAMEWRLAKFLNKEKRGKTKQHSTSRNSWTRQPFKYVTRSPPSSQGALL